VIDMSRKASVSLRTRKPVERLTLSDFASFPVWEYASDEEGVEGRDETWVRPVRTVVVPKRSYTHVAASFTMPCGKQFPGYVTVSTLAGPPDVCQGVIFYRRASLFVANPEAIGFREHRRRLLNALHLKPREVFPLSFRLFVPIAGRARYSGGVLP
jgi:hypothetical protein